MPHSLALLQDAPDRIIDLFKAHAVRQTIPSGTEISMEGDSCSYFPIVETGSIRVFKLGRDGQEVTLYRIREGESCILTLSCLMRSAPFPANARVEKECTLYLIPAATFKAWSSDEAFWRNYVIGHLSTTLNRIVGLLENMLFRSVELRLVDALLEHCPAGQTSVQATHQDIANEIGSAREVISRNLKEFEREGLVALGRGEIRILDRGKLLRMSELL
ncbi:MAG: Crp/Fnr family transcriptional regulator [Bacteroidota bacterium]